MRKNNTSSDERGTEIYGSRAAFYSGAAGDQTETQKALVSEREAYKYYFLIQKNFYPATLNEVNKLMANVGIVRRSNTNFPPTSFIPSR